MTPHVPHVVVVGDVLLDRDVTGRSERLCPDTPAPVVDVGGVLSGPGGAGLTASLCAQPGVRVTLIAPVAEDVHGAEIRTALARLGVELVALGHRGATRCKTRVIVAGHTVVRLDEGGPGTPMGPLPPDAVTAIEQADVVLVSDYGAGTTADAGLRRALEDRTQRHAGQRVRRCTVWDPHPRSGAPVPGCTVVTPNLGEALAAAGATADQPADVVATALHSRWAAHVTCVTTGGEGAWLVDGSGSTSWIPTEQVEHGDACGAGDRFSATVAVSLARGLLVSEAVGMAVQAAAAWVRDGGSTAYRRRLAAHQGASAGAASAAPSRDTPRDTPQDIVRDVRERGGVLVATGGCFDVLHAGHVASLQAARRLGDGLAVLLNSDASVRRLKGPGRPVQNQQDRARVLLGLSCVDQVIVFDEDDPRAALDRLRPDVWAKGGDYSDADLRESGLVRSWGGRVVLLPYLAGRSTTAILHDSRDSHVAAQRSRATDVVVDERTR